MARCILYFAWSWLAFYAVGPGQGLVKASFCQVVTLLMPVKNGVTV